MENKTKLIKLIRRFRKSPLYFIEKMWGLTPQPIKEEYKIVAQTAPLDEFNEDWFEGFEKGKHITWQQYVYFLALEKALRGEAQRRISIKSGHGVGKTAELSWTIIWFLFCFKNSQIPCTSPTSDQLKDILWKELSKWIDKINNQFVKDIFEWQESYLRVKENPNEWFARARTGKKENPEALAGIHADNVLLVVDEASGVHNKVYEVAEGSLTNDNVFVILISNPTRNDGYFYDTHKSDRDAWQNLTFNSEESPIVDWAYVDRIIDKYGRDSDEYLIRVEGKFAGESKMDDKGWLPLITEDKITYTQDELFRGNKRLGIDPSGEGQDSTEWVLRDEFKAKCIASEKISKDKSIAEKTLTLTTHYDIDDGEDITIDNFGVGADVSKNIAVATKGSLDCNGVNVGDPPKDKETFINLRAEIFWRMRNWILSGGMLVKDRQLIQELISIKYKRNIKGKIQIMSKEQMKKEGIKSPNKADGLALTFFKEEEPDDDYEEEELEPLYNSIGI